MSGVRLRIRRPGGHPSFDLDAAAKVVTGFLALSGALSLLGEEVLGRALFAATGAVVLTLLLLGGVVVWLDSRR